VGSRHPEEGIAKFEQELLEAVNSLGFGPMGTGGRTTVLDVHVEYGLSHTGALPVAVNIQCAITRRCVARITRAGEITYGDTIDWSYR
jgi:fumarate hydratase subunit alpha